MNIIQNMLSLAI